MGNATARSLYPRERNPVPIVQEAGWDPGPACTDAKNFAPTGISTTERPARNALLPKLCTWIVQNLQIVQYKWVVYKVQDQKAVSDLSSPNICSLRVTRIPLQSFVAAEM